MAEAIAEMKEMDSVSRAGPHLHYEEVWTYKLQDTTLKKLMEPDHQAQTGEWIHHNRELQTTEDQFHRRTRVPEIERLHDIQGEPDHGRRTAVEQGQVLAKRQEAGRREARSKSVNHRRNLSATWDCNSPSPPPPITTREEKVHLKDKGLHAVAHSKVVTYPRTRSMSRKVKEVMTQERYPRSRSIPVV